MSYKKKRSKEKKKLLSQKPKKKLTPYFFFESKVDPILNCKISTQKNKKRQHFVFPRIRIGKSHTKRKRNRV